MKRIIQDQIGAALHSITNRKFFKKINRGNALILMSGPSNEKDCFLEEKFDLAITSNLTNPEIFSERVISSEYIHCFSDPDILLNCNKREKFAHILSFAKQSNNYTLLLPVSYLKYDLVRRNAFSKCIGFYNTNNSFKNKNGLVINATSFPNMNTILLDCALPFASYIGMNRVFISGFDAYYGSGKKAYSNTNFVCDDKGRAVERWEDIVKSNAIIMTSVLKEINGTQIEYSSNSGFGKYVDEELNNNW